MAGESYIPESQHLLPPQLGRGERNNKNIDQHALRYMLMTGESENTPLIPNAILRNGGREGDGGILRDRRCAQ
jgi:hypothetical protein